MIPTRLEQLSEPVRRALSSTDFLLEVARGTFPNFSLVQKFGSNSAVGTSFVPVAVGGIYRTPQVGSAAQLRVKAGGDANDTAAGSGAREITIEGLGVHANPVTAAIPTNGASASSYTSVKFLRVFRAYVSKSGTYATASAGSHAADITIESSTEDWLTISTASSSFPRAQSEIGAYTIPSGYRGYVYGLSGSSDTSKTTDLLFFRRGSILETSAPYDSMRVLWEDQITSDVFQYQPRSPVPILGPADVGVLAQVNTGTARVEVDFEIVLEKIDG